MGPQALIPQHVDCKVVHAETQADDFSLRSAYHVDDHSSHDNLNSTVTDAPSWRSGELGGVRAPGRGHPHAHVIGRTETVVERPHLTLAGRSHMTL